MNPYEGLQNLGVTTIPASSVYETFYSLPQVYLANSIYNSFYNSYNVHHQPESSLSNTAPQNDPSPTVAPQAYISSAA